MENGANYIWEQCCHLLRAIRLIQNKLDINWRQCFQYFFVVLQSIPASRIYRVLKTIPNYVYQLRAPRHFPKRSYEIDGYLKYMETDLAFMKPFAVSPSTKVKKTQIIRLIITLHFCLAQFAGFYWIFAINWRIQLQNLGKINQKQVWTNHSKSVGNNIWLN